MMYPERKRIFTGLPSALLTEVVGYLDIHGVGTTCSVCKQLYHTCSDEQVWAALWEGPLPDDCPRGSKFAHHALWLMANGSIEQTRLDMCQPAGMVSPCRTGTHCGRVGTGEGGDSSHAGGNACGAGFPMQVSCMAIHGETIAAVVGQEITLWDLPQSILRGHVRVSGHESVTCLLLRRDYLLAGDNSGLLRMYNITVGGGMRLHELHAHLGRITAMDACVHPTVPLKDAVEVRGGNEGQSNLRGTNRARPIEDNAAANTNRQAVWNQGHGWGTGWIEPSGPSPWAATLPSQRTISASSAPLAVTAKYGEPAGQSHEPATTEAVADGRINLGNRGRARKEEEYLDTVFCCGEEQRMWKGQYHGDGKDTPRFCRGYGGSSQYQSGSEPFGGHLQRRHHGGGVSLTDANEGIAYYDRVTDFCVSCGRQMKRGKDARERVDGGVRPEREVIVTASDDGTAKAWDAASGRFLRTYAGHTRAVTSLQLTRMEGYGAVLVTGGGDSSVRVWKLDTGCCLEVLDIESHVTHPDGHGARVGCLQTFGNTIIVGKDVYMNVWKLCAGKSPRLIQPDFCEHQRPVRRFAVVGRYIVTCSGDYVIRLWDARTGTCVREIEIKSGAAITGFRLSGMCLLTTSLFDAGVVMTRFLPAQKDGMMTV